ncbi:hypothetical protein BaRGS_00029976 [Batillaria attramentaria]|uniref:RGS domain-containing protein n=1 Tax=Batillaria attramentaria TaxID=370345 RepID=A0ABD0JVZ6_9CAEN
MRGKRFVTGCVNMGTVARPSEYSIEQPANSYFIATRQPPHLLDMRVVLIGRERRKENFCQSTKLGLELEERLKRSTQSPSQEEEAEDEDWGNARRPPPPHARPIHKTASADAAMMARDEYGNVNSQAKAKRSLAKTMKRKLLFLRRRHTDTTLGSVLKGDGKQVTKIHPEDALQWSRSFESLLMDKAGLELFRGFLRSEFSDENLEFWIACEDFKSVKSSKVPAVAQKIYTDFVAAQAPREINLDAKTRVKTLSNLDHPSKEIFEEAQRKVQALMEKDSYPRFLESDVYQRIIRSQKS